MAIAYPLALPSAFKFMEVEWDPQTVVGVATSPFTLSSQTNVWPGQAWAFQANCPPIKNTSDADDCVSFLLSLNGRQGTFNLGDRTRRTTRGTAAGAWTCGAGNAALSTTLVIAGGAGTFAKGDWIQIGNKLHKVIKLVDATHIDVWPRLRSAYANGTVITYTDAVGLFRLQANQDMKWSISVAKKYGLKLTGIEAVESL